MDIIIEKFIDTYFNLLGSSCEFVTILEHIIHHISWCNDFISFEFPCDYDEYEAKKRYLNQHEDFQIEDSVLIYMNTYFIASDISELIIKKSVFISNVVNISFGVFADFVEPHPSAEELQKADKLIKQLKQT